VRQSEDDVSPFGKKKSDEEEYGSGPGDRESHDDEGDLFAPPSEHDEEPPPIEDHAAAQDAPAQAEATTVVDEPAAASDEPEAQTVEDAEASPTRRVSVVNEPEPDGREDDEYRWHSGKVFPTGVPDAVEFIDVHKAFGRNKILRGLNMGDRKSVV